MGRRAVHRGRRQPQSICGEVTMQKQRFPWVHQHRARLIQEPSWSKSTLSGCHWTASHVSWSDSNSFCRGKRVSQVAQSLLNWNIIEIIAQKALYCFMRVAMRLLCNAGSWLLCLAFHKPGDLSEVNPFRTSSPGTSSLHSSSNNSCSLRAVWLGWPSCRSS